MNQRVKYKSLLSKLKIKIFSDLLLFECLRNCKGKKQSILSVIARIIYPAIKAREAFKCL